MHPLFSAALFCLSLISLPAQAGNEIHIQLAAEPVSLDPAHADDDYALQILSNTMDGLFGYDGAGKLENRLVETYTVSKDGKIYTFHLKKNVKWSDGKPVQATDFITGLKRTLNPATASKLANLFFSIKGAKDYCSKKAPESALGLHEKNGDLIVELENPTPYFPHVLTEPQAAPVRGDLLSARAGTWSDSFPSTGPYHIALHLQGQKVLLEANPNYWGEKPKINSITFQIIADEGTAVKLFETGYLDLVNHIPVLEIQRLRDKGLVKDYPQASTYFLSFNTRKAPFDDLVFRKAVAGSIDREGILRSLKSQNLPASSWIPPGIEGYTPYKSSGTIFQHALDQVALLSDAKKPEVAAAFNTNDVNSIVMQKIQSDLATHAKLKINLSNMDWSTYVKQIRSDPPELYRYGRSAPFLDPIWHLSSFKSDDPNNPTGWKNKKYDQLVDEIANLPAGARRLQKIRTAEKILTEEDTIVIPVFYISQTYLVSPKIKNFRVNPMSVVPFKELSKD